jgi:N6-adenosine-specific RNA methylase IME4
VAKDLTAAEDLLLRMGDMQYGTILVDPPWQFSNRTGKMAPEHRRLSRYSTMSLEEIGDLPVSKLALAQSHLYLWVPNALIAEGLEVMKRWGFIYKTNIVWYKIRKDGGPDGRGVGFYFRNVTELLLFGTRGNFRTLPPGRRQVNLVASQKREHSRKPEEIFPVIESCSPAPYLELFAREKREGWYQWGNEVEKFMPEEDEAEKLPYGELVMVQPRLFERPADHEAARDQKPQQATMDNREESHSRPRTLTRSRDHDAGDRLVGK